jgi:hypothetical protein
MRASELSIVSPEFCTIHSGEAGGRVVIWYSVPGTMLATVQRHSTSKIHKAIGDKIVSHKLSD